ncbi:MAG: bifunctional phosphopantothenoylcysteine decarboxylase/phosphopantothenate--cysteine ligase CoaBC, partial [Smithellaceae bacterium]|nr:bifunctional phosphopantothenoylcysteine decarboxylase/phosphopantothenate--cysteine ligase CoaBC [Smithellaceae bacterium]
MLEGKKIILGITGGIAAYKAAELTRLFVGEKALVKIVMTKSAQEFITPMTMQTLSCRPVAAAMFGAPEDYEIAHITLAEWADIVIVAPATANFIGKVASGIADDLLTTTVMATKAPVLICPAMNSNMYANPIVQGNIERLETLGYHIMETGYGELACKTEGPGRLIDVTQIVEETEYILAPKDLYGERFLITAGPTREPFDPVRFITNYSSGKMGYALARAARRRGAEVTLVSGPVSLSVPRGVTRVSVSSALQMKDAVMTNLDTATIVIKAAAVADYRPSHCEGEKIKKKEGTLEICLERNPDIIAEIGKRKGNRTLVGFAMESENLLENAREKLMAKNMDLIVANDLTMEGAGFQTDTNVIKILYPDGVVEELPRMEKLAVADC